MLCLHVMFTPGGGEMIAGNKHRKTTTTKTLFLTANADEMFVSCRFPGEKSRHFIRRHHPARPLLQKQVHQANLPGGRCYGNGHSRIQTRKLRERIFFLVSMNVSFRVQDKMFSSFLFVLMSFIFYCASGFPTLVNVTVSISLFCKLYN